MYELPKDLPVLTGSPKQIAWASNIRRDMLYRAAGSPEYYPQVLAAIRKETRAKVFIENRGLPNSPFTAVHYMLEEVRGQ